MNAHSTGFTLPDLLPNQVGFDYSRAVLEINHSGWSYERIADYCGYEDKSAISRIASGDRTPSHPAGEAIYILYVELFGKKPPLRSCQLSTTG